MANRARQMAGSSAHCTNSSPNSSSGVSCAVGCPAATRTSRMPRLTRWFRAARAAREPGAVTLLPPVATPTRTSPGAARPRPPWVLVLDQVKRRSRGVGRESTLITSESERPPLAAARPSPALNARESLGAAAWGGWTEGSLPWRREPAPRARTASAHDKGG